MKLHNHLRMKRFTLIELLVVIAIVAILAAMLLLALNKARDKAKTIKCIGNEKQLSQVFLLYVSDYGDYFPLPYGYGLPGAQDFWTTYIINNYLNKSNKVLICPSATDFTRDSVTNTPHYGYNIRVAKAAAPEDWGGKLNQIPQPSKIIQLVDAIRSKTSPTQYFGYYEAQSFDYVHTRHDGGFSANVIYCDGHVETQRASNPPPAANVESDHPFHAKHFYRL